MDREKEKKKEYESRADMDSNELGVSAGELEQMKELDFMYGGQTTAEELEEIQEEEEQKSMDPYMKKKKRFMKPQKFRTITVGPVSLLKNG